MNAVNDFLDFFVDVVISIRNWNLRRPGRAARLVVVPGPPVNRTSRTPHPVPLSGYFPVSTSLNLDQQIPLTVHGVTDSGAVTTTFAFPPAWSLADPAAGTLTVVPDGLGATFVPAVAGDHVINVAALAQAGDPAPLTASVTLTVTAAAVGIAVALVIVPGTPEPRPLGA